MGNHKGVVAVRADSSRRAFYKEFMKVVDAADVVIEVLDARDPLSCRCLDVERLVRRSGADKKVILLLNKIGQCSRVQPVWFFSSICVTVICGICTMLCAKGVTALHCNMLPVMELDNIAFFLCKQLWQLCPVLLCTFAKEWPVWLCGVACLQLHTYTHRHRRQRWG